MATKSVHKIEVDSSQFKAFYELFQSYSSTLEDMPEEWKKLTDEMGGASEGMEQFAQLTGSSKEALALAATQAHLIANAVSGATKGTQSGTKAQKEFLGVLQKSGKAMKDMAKDAKALGKEVFGIGKFLMKIGVIGAGVAGLSGILSGLGLRDLARSAVSNQREARGIGVSTGELQAFSTDFGRYADPSILNRMADAQSDMTKVAYAGMATGKSISEVQGSSPDKLAMAMMQRAHDWWNQTPASMRNAQTMSTTGLSQFMSFEEVRRLGAMSNAEFSSAKGNYLRDSKNLNVSDRSTDSWFEFQRQIELTGKILKTDLTERLSDLGPHLAEFVQTLSKDGKELIDHVLTPENIRKLGDAITSLTRWFEKLSDTVFGNKTGAVSNGSPSSSTPGSTDAQSSNGSDSVLNFMEGNKRALKDALGLGEPDQAKKQAFLATLDQKHSLPSGMLDAVWNKESSRGKNLLSPAGAKGDFGFMDTTAKQYGVDVNDFGSSANGAGQMYSDLLSKYKGDIRKALAAYNWGPGNVDKDIRDNGYGWESKLPDETQKYINDILTQLAKQQAVKVSVNVTNNTAARVAVSANAGAIS